jgi:Flp pilus assembly protein TadG
MSCRSWIMSLHNRPPSGWPAAALRPCLAQIGARIGALARDRRGMSAVEFGLAAPVFLAMLTPVIDIGLAFSQQIRVNQAVESGAQYASSNPYAGSTWASAVSSAITNATSLSVNPSVGAETCGCPNSTSTAIVTGSYGSPPTCTGSCPDGSNPGYYVTLSASLTYTSVMPYSILGSSTTLSSQAVVRVQ